MIADRVARASLHGPTGQVACACLTGRGMQGRILQLPAVRDRIGLRPTGQQQAAGPQQSSQAAQAFAAAMHLTPQRLQPTPPVMGPGHGAAPMHLQPKTAQAAASIPTTAQLKQMSPAALYDLVRLCMSPK